MFDQDKKYAEEALETFDKLLEMRGWERINNLFRNMEEDGYPDLEIDFSYRMTDEETEAYKKWDRDVNGDTETQMDDNS